MKNRTGAEMPIKPDAALIAARAHDQADRDARDHALHEIHGFPFHIH
jgi:hypothetical protein